MLAFIAARTKHIRLAPAVTVLPLHHPIRVAEEAGTLDTEAAAALPSLENTPQTPTDEQVDAANAFLKQNWDAAVS